MVVACRGQHAYGVKKKLEGQVQNPSEIERMSYKLVCCNAVPAGLDDGDGVHAEARLHRLQLLRLARKARTSENKHCQALTTISTTILLYCDSNILIRGPAPADAEADCDKKN